MDPGVYPYLSSSTEFLVYTRRGLAGSVLIGGGKSVRTGRTSIRNGGSLGSLGSRGSSSGNNLLRVPRMLFEKTGFAASSPGCLLTVLHTYHTTSGCSDNELLSDFLDAQEDTVQKHVCNLNLLPARFK